MLILVLFIAYLGGVFTILSPCILPVVPFVFARSDQPFHKTGLPMLIGMALCFVSLAFLSITGSKWIIEANSWGRILALVIFSFLGLTLLFPKFAYWLFKPAVRLGNFLQNKTHAQAGTTSSILIGIAIGLLWTPCAGPILGLVLTSAAVSGATVTTMILLIAYTLGAISSLALLFLASHKILAFLKKNLGVGEWIKRIVGIVILVFVICIATGVDTKIITKLSYINTSKIEQHLLDSLANNTPIDTKVLPTFQYIEQPSLKGATGWLNSKPLDLQDLKGRVVVIDFWTYSCINCLRTLPYLKAWAQKYSPYGLSVIGVHTPEFAFEKDPDNVKKAVSDLGITYPIAMDNDYAIWKNFKNRYWPAHYFIDAKGVIRYFHFGEGNYDQSEEIIRHLLNEASLAKELPNTESIQPGRGVQAEASSSIQSPETYFGFERQNGFASSPELKADVIQNYHAPVKLKRNTWSLSGDWQANAEMSELHSSAGILAFRFKARDLHLVLGSKTNNMKFRVTLDDQAPGAEHGDDIDADGWGVIQKHRLYQLIRQQKSIERTFKIEFFQPGVKVYAVTFG